MIHWLTINNNPIPPFPSIPVFSTSKMNRCFAGDVCHGWWSTITSTKSSYPSHHTQSSYPSHHFPVIIPQSSPVIIPQSSYPSHHTPVSHVPVSDLWRHFGRDTLRGQVSWVLARASSKKSASGETPLNDDDDNNNNSNNNNNTYWICSWYIYIYM